MWDPLKREISKLIMIVILFPQLVINQKSDLTVPVPEKPVMRPPKKELLEWSKQIVTRSPSSSKSVQMLFTFNYCLDACVLSKAAASADLQKLLKGIIVNTLLRMKKALMLPLKLESEILIVHKLAAVDKVWMKGLSRYGWWD